MADAKTGEPGLMMQTRLGHLRSQLDMLRRKRAFVRGGTALCKVLTFCSVFLLTAFVCDWIFNLSPVSRIGMLVLLCAAGIGAVIRWMGPLISMNESLVDVALIAERNNGIDSDLVAALQFDEPHAETWGSQRLATAVVDYVSEFSPSLNVFERFSYSPLPRQALICGASLLLIVGTAITVPDHVFTFWNRLFLSTAHYPTKTRIHSVSVNGQEVPVFHRGSTAQVRIPYGVPVAIRAACEGAIPVQGHATLSSLRNESGNRIELQQVRGETDVFQGELSSQAESFRIQLQIGDAYSDPVEVTIVPLPLVDVIWSVTPPLYASATLKQDEFGAGVRQFSVLDGSRAALTLRCLNKPLSSARLTVGDKTFALLASSDAQADNQTWVLPPGTPFESIREAMKYEIQVTDQDALSLETPLVGQVRLRSDRAPRIAASAVTRLVLPSAQPVLDYAAVDDFGIASIAAIVQISREGGEFARDEITLKDIADSDQPMTSLRGQVRIPLTKYKLAKGDEVKVALQAKDWRGGTPGEVGETESIRFSVTDLSGILAQTGEEDRKSAKQLDEILQREMGISGDKK